jgi:ABC-type transport system involved in cytochrome c biogenesis permease subunit
VGRRVSAAVYTLGAVLNLYLAVARGIEAGHFPFSNMYETMLSLGACIYILFLITEMGLKVRAPWMDPLIAAVVITPAAFVFEKEIRPLMPALQSPLFFPHVFTYILAYAAMAKACALGCYTLAIRDREGKIAYEKGTYHVICLGFPLLTAGLLLGAVWAKLAWGDYWSWDPKEMWSFITWMTYLGYFHVRYRMGPRHRLVPWLAILGFFMVVITLLIVNLTRIFSGLHSYA